LRFYGNLLLPQLQYRRSFTSKLKMDRRKKATITCSLRANRPLELCSGDEHSTRSIKIFIIGPTQKSMLADEPIWFRHTRHYQVCGAVLVNAMPLRNFTELWLESEGGGGR
jgi:hypothetical protein